LAQTDASEGIEDVYHRWYHSAPFDCGNTISRALSGGLPDLDSQANGALMRIAPYALLEQSNIDRALDLVAQDTAITHPNSSCLAASRFWIRLLNQALQDSSAESIWQYALQNDVHENDPVILQAIELAKGGQLPSVYEHMGWLRHALMLGLWHLRHGTSFEAALCEIVAMGGDSDTNASIVGGLLGAIQGREAIPVSWRNAVLSSQYILHPKFVDINSAEIYVRPPEYWPQNVEALIEWVH
jgi:ADP-ribosylglycohydrolase